MSLYWCYRADQAAAPYFLAVTPAEDQARACEAFGEQPGSLYVHELTTPALVTLCEGLEPGALRMLEVASLPSAYDRFRGADGRLDYDAMEDAGFA